MTRLTLALDVMGGDFGPSVTVPAALQALNSNSQLTLLLVGNPDAITPLLAKADFEQRSRLQIIPAQSVIASDARPSQAIRASRGSSMRVALELVKEGRAQACVSAGNTGALMGLAKLLLKPLEGIERPALVTVLPHQQRAGLVALLRCGSCIPDCLPSGPYRSLNPDRDAMFTRNTLTLGGAAMCGALLLGRPSPPHAPAPCQRRVGAVCAAPASGGGLQV